MKRQQLHMHGHRSRRDAGARVCAWSGMLTTRALAVAAMLGTFTAKINPCGVSGGLPREGNP
jgi:hypothetical protein